MIVKGKIDLPQAEDRITRSMRYMQHGPIKPTTFKAPPTRPMPTHSGNMSHVDLLLEEAAVAEQRGNYIAAYDALERALYAERKAPWLRLQHYNFVDAFITKALEGL